MVRALVFYTARKQTWAGAVGIHHANRRHATRFGATEDNVFTVRRFTGAKIPDRRIRLREARHRAVSWVEAADFRSAAGEFRFEITVKVVHVWALRLEFPRDF